MSEAQFSSLDYFFFVIVLFVSIIIGLYYAKRQHSVVEYFLGGRNLGLLPVSFSLAATSVSGSSIVGQSIEVYAFGVHHWIALINALSRTIFTHLLFLPIFYELQLLSSFQYLEMRFDRNVKLLASGLYVITGFIIISMTIYVPSLVLQEVTGFNLYSIVVTIGLICIWYTAFGGIKAVVWTDVFQCILILASSMIIMIVGLKSVGGFVNVWEALKRGGRLTFLKTDLNPEVRGTIWATVFSDFFNVLYHFSLSQNCIQRYISLPTLGKAKISLWINTIFWILVILLQMIIGGIIYTTYEDCDPLKAGFVKKIDQIFPYFVQQKATLFAGFNGIFIAGISAAGLSTTSTLLNTISGTIYCDFLSTRIRSEKNFSWIIKIIVTLVGMIGIAMIFLVERMGTIFAITIQSFAMMTVALLGLFACGMFFPKINSKGAKCGVIVSMVSIGILIIGSLSKQPDSPLILRTDGCPFSNATVPSHAVQAVNSESELLWIFRINFQYYCIIGLLINISIAYIVSLLTGGNVVEDQRLLVRFLRQKSSECEPMNDHQTKRETVILKTLN